MDIRAKIIKLLALADSPNDFEAQAALKKARTLMAGHSLTPAQVVSQDATLLRKKTQITCSKRRNPWISSLAAVVASNYCCKSILYKLHAKQTVTIGFVGFYDDVVSCEEAFLQCLNHITDWIDKMHRRTKTAYDPNDVRIVCNSYAVGYIAGVRAVFIGEYCKGEQEVALMSVPNPQVLENIKTLEHIDFSGKDGIVHDVYKTGFDDGIKFHARYTLNKG